MHRLRFGTTGFRLILLIYLTIVAAEAVHAFEHPIHLEDSDCLVFMHGSQVANPIPNQLQLNAIPQHIEELVETPVAGISQCTVVFNPRAPPCKSIVTR